MGSSLDGKTATGVTHFDVIQNETVFRPADLIGHAANDTCIDDLGGN